MKKLGVRVRARRERGGGEEEMRGMRVNREVGRDIERRRCIDE